MEVLEISDRDQLEAVINTWDRVVIKFWADWCGPCKQFAPHFAKAAETTAVMSDERGRLQFVSVDVDRAPWAMEEFDVRGVPTVLLLDYDDEVRYVKSRTYIPLLEELRWNKVLDN